MNEANLQSGHVLVDRDFRHHDIFKKPGIYLKVWTYKVFEPASDIGKVASECRTTPTEARRVLRYLRRKQLI